MAEAYFRVFDEDNSGALSFFEFMLVKNAPKLDTPEDKLNWIFNAFDQDGGGSIDGEECCGVVEALFRMSGKVMEGDTAKTEIADCVENILAVVDVDGDGIITKQEFVENAMKSPFISNLVNTKINK